MTTCDLYLRLSDGRTENGTFAEREAKLRERAAVLDWTVNRVVIENDVAPGGTRSASAFKRRRVTLPDGSTALRVVRPGFRSVLDDITSGRVGAVLAEDLDRTMRDPRDGEDLLDAVKARKASAESLSGSLRLTAGGTDSEQMVMRMLVAVAQKASQDTARRVSAGRERKAHRGQWGGGRRPYGFQPVQHPSGDHKNTVLVIDEAEAAVIRDAADQVLSGIPLREICRDLRVKGVSTVKGGQWLPDTLRAILVRPLTAGIVVYDGDATETLLPEEDRILDPDTWRAVCATLTDPARVTTPGPAPKSLGSGIYRCGSATCGGPLRVHRAGAHAAAPTYRCAEGRDGGHVGRIAAPLDDYVADVLCARLSRPDAADMFVSAPDVDTPALRAESETLRQRLDGLAAAFADGDITREQLRAGSARLRARLAEVDGSLASAVSTSPVAELIGAADVRATWDTWPLGKRRAVLADVLTVTVLPTTKRGRGFDPRSVRIEPAKK